MGLFLVLFGVITVILSIFFNTIWDIDSVIGGISLGALLGLLGGLLLTLISASIFSDYANFSYDRTEDSMIALHHSYRFDGKPSYAIKYEPLPLEGDTIYYLETSERFKISSNDIEVIVDSSYYPHLKYDIYTIDSWWLGGLKLLHDEEYEKKLNFVLTVNDEVILEEVLSGSKIEN